MHTTMWWFGAGVAFVSGAFAQPVQQQPSALFSSIGLTAQQVADIDAGRPVAKVLSWGASSEVYVFGAVYVDGSPAVYLKAARDIGRAAGASGNLGVGELPSTASVEDLSALTLDPDDIKALKHCREGSCDVQLPTAAIQAFHDGVKWSQPDVAGQVNGLARGMVLQLVREYRRGGNDALGVYRDKEHPARVAEQFEAMVSRSAALPNMLPELRQYLLRVSRCRSARRGRGLLLGEGELRVETDRPRQPRRDLSRPAGRAARSTSSRSSSCTRPTTSTPPST